MATVVHLDISNLKQFYNLYLYSFNREDSDVRRKFFDFRFKNADPWGILEKNKLVAGLYDLPFNIDFYGVNYSMNGIGDVMSFPEYSGKRYPQKILSTVLNKLWGENVSLSYLSPFSFRYYRKLGYEHVFNHVVYEIDCKKLEKLNLVSSKINEETCKIERKKFVDCKECISSFYKVNHPQKGNLIREGWWWEYLSLKNPDWLVGLFFEREELTGYVIYSIIDSTLVVKELLCKTSSSEFGLVNFVFNHRNIFKKIVIEDQSYDYWGYLFSEPYSVNTKIYPYMMARIVNLKNFILQYPFKSSKLEKTFLKVNDNVIVQNNGIWCLEIDDKNVSFYKTNKMDKNFLLDADINQLVPILLGSYSLKWASFHNKLNKVNGNISFLDKALIKAHPQFNDYF